MAQPVEALTPVTVPSYNFTRPSDTTPYASGDLVANSTSAASVVPMSWKIGPPRVGTKKKCYIAGVRLRLDKSDVSNAQFRVHLYSAIPTFTSAGDNSAFSTVVATGYASWIGSYDVTIAAIDAAGVAGTATPTSGLIAPQEITGIDGSETVVYGLIEARAAYTPKSAGVITAELLVEHN